MQFHHFFKIVKKVNTTSRWIIWYEDIYECYGSIIRSICIFSLRDLQFLITRREFFANKFILEENPIVYQCMEGNLKT